MDLMSSTPRSRARFTLIVWAFISGPIGFFGYFYMAEPQPKNLPFRFIAESHTLSVIFGSLLILFAIVLMYLAVSTWIKNDMSNSKKDFNEEEK